MTEEAKGRRPVAAFANGVKPVHAAILLLVLLIKNGLVWSETANEEHGDEGAHAEEDHGEGHGHGYQVFHVEFDRVQLPFIISLWIFVSSLAKIGFHMTPKLPSIFPESCLLIVIGIIIGVLLVATSDEVPTTLTPDSFFLFMLPPIILDAGYFMPNRLFFDHLGTILLMAVVGTVFNMLTIGASLYALGTTGIFGADYPGILETFLFASLIVAVDPVAVLAVFEEIHVNEILYIVVFGESLLNDAVTVVLYHMFEAYVEIGEENLVPTDFLKGLASFIVVAGGGTIIGIVWGFVTGFVTRFTNHARVLEPLFVFIMAYMSYLNAEIFHMSGILAITFCGITMKNYVERNISSKSQTTLKYGLKMLSSSSETIIFMFLGVATIHDDHEWNWAFVIITITLCSFFRIVGVLLLSAIANHYRLHKLKAVDQFVMMYGGLRGAVAFALVLLIDKKSVPHAPMFVTTTIAVVYWTVFVQGITIKPLVKFLRVKTSSEKDPTMNERIAGRFMDHVVSGMEGILGELGNLRLRDMYKYFDTKYIKPCLLRENQYRDPKIIETFENLTNKDAVEFMKRNPTQFAGLKSMVDLTQASSTSNLMASSASMAYGTEHHDNLDMKELGYTPSQKDVTENKIHHMLSENMFMPRARPRRMSYSRHAVDDDDLAMNHDVNYRVHMQVRRMVSESKKKRKNKRGKPNGTVSNGGNSVRFENEMTQNERGARVKGSSKMLQDEIIHEVINENRDNGANHSGDEEDEDEGGIVFAPRQSQSISGLTLSENLALPGDRHRLPPGQSPGISHRNWPTQFEKVSTTPVATPWLIKGGIANPAYVPDPDMDQEDRVEPTKTESTLPWLRGEERDRCQAPLKQKEFPSWLKNEDYMQHGTPNAEILAGPAPTADPGAGSRRNSEAEFQERPRMDLRHGRRPSVQPDTVTEEESPKDGDSESSKL